VRPFAYERPSTAAEAVAAAARQGDDVRYLGGGTNLVDLMHLGVERPRRLINVSKLDTGDISETPGGGLRVGAAITNSELAAHPLVRRHYPMLASAVLQGASGQLRNLATVGGNLLQRTRCPYFQDVTKPCNKRSPGDGCSAVDGDHYNLAIFGHSPNCVATHPSDMAVALVALDAAVHVTGPRGDRIIELCHFHRLPGDAPQRDTVLAPAELITAVTIPPLRFARRSQYRKVRERASFAFALVSVGAALDVADGVVRDSRIALGGVAHVPWRAERAERALRGRPASPASFAAAADAELAAADPLVGTAYKVPLARSVLTRTLEELCA
jgi:xanthine dehydrogenase YagS FAD-binding subunit